MPLFVEDEELAVLAGTFLRVSSLGVPRYAAFEIGKRFLQAQGDFWGGLFALLVSTPVLIILNWLFVFVSS